ncbi:MAG TPA: cytochrome c oxidase assembly protein [Opitutaceae bacterium]|mgnify:CR=1 FL=1|nr:cytochrome c oxidase assembly protein [Opitutaceae bacterium]HRJ46703.1 cytochrome c oxidase assembly protein [Opitutaceae bacterium]
MIDWRHWHNEPYLVGGLIFLGWLYAILTGPLRGRIAPGQPFLRGRACAFYAALIIFYLAVGSPLDQIGERFLFSAHMVQHQLLTYPAAILFLLGLPRWLVDPVLDRPGVRGLARFAGHPLICGLIYTLVISIWHVPALYDWALRDKFVHVLEHVMFFGAALFYWWPHLSPSKIAPPVSYAAQMLYQLGIVIGMTPLFAYITFSHDILYPTYEFAPRIIDNFSPAQDQLLAGTMMKLGGLLVATTAIAVSFFRWYQTTELQTRRR